MAAKKKAKKRTTRQNWCQMVIRVRVPLEMAKTLKVAHVRGVNDRGWQELEILNAYYDLPRQPDAMPST